MLRTALVSLLPATLIVTGWRQLEQPASRELAAAAALAIVPALLPRQWLRWLGAFGAFLGVVALASGLSPLDARPRDADHDYFGPLISRLWNGFLDFYDVTIPFNPAELERMHGVVVLAVFAFTLGASLAIAVRRPVLAATLTFVGAAWPVTLIRDAPTTARGALLLVAALVLLAALRPGAGRGVGQTALVGAAVLLAALIAVSSPAVAKGSFLRWQTWEPYTRPHHPVGVSYVWDSDYDGIKFPKTPTRVLTIKAPRTAPYWRATTLDSFVDGNWREDAVEVDPTVVDGRDALVADPLLPNAARNARNWILQNVTVRALRDTHLVGATQPVAFERGVAQAYSNGVAYVGRLHRDQDYRVWSYAPQPTPTALARSKPDYPPLISDDGYFLGVGDSATPPPFGIPRREATMRELFDRGLLPAEYRPLYRTAVSVVGRPRNPYAAVVALEAWFRSSGNFEYDESPPIAVNRPPLVAFVVGHRRGYCQHFAGAMALMLRYLGVPARVGAGFGSGRFDANKEEWTVSDTNAHTWVEAWFKGYGWLPFDPTPGRGRLRASYSSSSLFFDADGATSAFAGVGAASLGLDILRSQIRDRGDGGRDRLRGADPGRRTTRRARAANSDEGGLRGSLIALLLGIAVLLTGALWGVKTARRRARYMTRDPRRVAGAVRLDLADYLADQGMPLPASATPRELSSALERNAGVKGERLASALSTARYAPDATAADAAAQARTELRAVRRALRRRLGATARLRGLLSLRSFGIGPA
ncbi:MAG: transglutaminaseTgpA domain-containing protein [Gaiellaceae bacterium]